MAVQEGGTAGGLDRQTDRQTDGQEDRQKGCQRQTERQIEMVSDAKGQYRYVIPQLLHQYSQQ